MLNTHLAGCRELLEEADDHVTALPIETRCRLVKEEQGRSGDQFDADCDSLPLLDIESNAWHADDCVLDVLELQQVDDLIHVRELLGVRDVSGLSQESRKLECLTDS